MELVISIVVEGENVMGAPLCTISGVQLAKDGAVVDVIERSFPIASTFLLVEAIKEMASDASRD